MKTLKEELQEFRDKHNNLTEQTKAGFDLAFKGMMEVLGSHGLVKADSNPTCPQGYYFDQSLGKCVPNL